MEPQPGLCGREPWPPGPQADAQAGRQCHTGAPGETLAPHRRHEPPLPPDTNCNNRPHGAFGTVRPTDRPSAPGAWPGPSPRHGSRPGRPAWGQVPLHLVNPAPPLRAGEGQTARGGNSAATPGRAGAPSPPRPGQAQEALLLRGLGAGPALSAPGTGPPAQAAIEPAFGEVGVRGRGVCGAAGRGARGGPRRADAGAGPGRAWAGGPRAGRAGRAGAVCSRPRGAARCPRRETGGRWAGSPARARARLSPPARWSGCWRGAARLGRRRPGAGERAEQRTAPRPPQAPGSRRSAPDSSGPAAARAFQWAARTCSTRACRSVRPRARISGRGGGAAGGAAALCASARARRRARAAGPGAGPGSAERVPRRGSARAPAPPSARHRAGDTKGRGSSTFPPPAPPPPASWPAVHSPGPVRFPDPGSPRPPVPAPPRPQVPGLGSRCPAPKR